MLSFVYIFVCTSMVSVQNKSAYKNNKNNRHLQEPDKDFAEKHKRKSDFNGIICKFAIKYVSLWQNYLVFIEPHYTDFVQPNEKINDTFLVAALCRFNISPTYPI